MKPIIEVTGVSKRYRLGEFSAGSLREEVERAWKGLWRKNGHSENGDNAALAAAESAKDFWALRDVSFSVQPGEVVGIIGRNGAGKSTLLKILSRITEPTDGEIVMRGRVASLLEVGTGFHPELSGRENIYLNGAILGMKKGEIDRKFDEIVDFAEVGKFIDTPVKRYSSGMYVRLAFAVAAHLEPEILIVDEVLAVGDSQFQQKCIGKMKEVSTEHGRTVLVVSHNIDLIKKLCTTGVYLTNGTINMTGGIDQILGKYLGGMRNLTGSNLRERQDRTGAGETRIVKVWIEAADGANIKKIASGEKLTVAIEYESMETKSSLQKVRASIAVFNLLEQVLFFCSTELTSSSPSKCAPNGVFRCTIPRLPLSGGQYGIMVYFEENGVTQDWVANAHTLEVEDGDYFGSGQLYPPGWQGKAVLVDHGWECPEI